MEDIFKNKTYNILESFIEHPTKEFSARGISRELKISHPTALKYFSQLLQKELIKKRENTLYPTFYANIENKKYKYFKRELITEKIKNSRLIEFIQKKTLPNTIILFGSGAKGTYNEKSDVDIFVEAKEQKINLLKYEEILGKKINLLFEKNINNLSEELKNNIINGIKLYGFIRIK